MHWSPTLGHVCVSVCVRSLPDFVSLPADGLTQELEVDGHHLSLLLGVSGPPMAALDVLEVVHLADVVALAEPFHERAGVVRMDLKKNRRTKKRTSATCELTNRMA